MQMKKWLTSLIVILFLCFVNKAVAGPDTIKIAILPFTVFIDPNNLPGGVNEINAARRAELNRYRFQRALHTWFLKKSQKYSFIFQDVFITNTLLKQSGLIDSTDTSASKKLCKALGVDAVIFGNSYLANERETVGHEVVKGIVGVDAGPYSKISIDLNLYNSSGNIEWSKTFKNYTTYSPDVTIDRFMRKVYKTFPYKK